MYTECVHMLTTYCINFCSLNGTPQSVVQLCVCVRACACVRACVCGGACIQSPSAALKQVMLSCSGSDPNWIMYDVNYDGMDGVIV